MQWFKVGIQRSLILLEKFNQAAAVFSGTLVFLYAFLLLANVALRFFFSKPISGVMEIGQIVLATVIFFNLAYAQMEKAHIRVTFVLDRMPDIWRQRAEITILLIGFVMMVIMAWFSFSFAWDSFLIRETHMSVNVPIWPIKVIFFIGWSILSAQFLIEFSIKLTQKGK